MLAVALGRAVVESLWQLTLVGAVAATLALAVRGARWRYGLWSGALGSGVGWFVWTFVTGMNAQAQVPAGSQGFVPLVRGLGMGEAGVGPTSKGLGLFEFVALLWGVGFAIVAWRTLGQWRSARRLRVRDVWAPRGAWLRVFERVRGELGVSRRVGMLISGAAPGPMVVGWISPVVIVPASVLMMLSPEQVRLVLKHELAHIRRYDHLVNMLQVLVEAVLFYHPVVWWMSHQMRIEREHCCDDAAVRDPGDAMVFARALTELETVRTRSRATLGLHQGGSLMKRIQRILDGSDRRCDMGSVWVLAVLTTVGLIASAGIAHAAINAQSPREDAIGAVRAGFASGVMTEDQARRIYNEIIFPGSDLQKRFDEEIAYLRDQIARGDLSAAEGDQMLTSTERSFPERIERAFRARVLGMSEDEVTLSMLADDLSRMVESGGLSREYADEIYQEQVGLINQKRPAAEDVASMRQRDIGVVAAEVRRALGVAREALDRSVESGALTQEQASARYESILLQYKEVLESSEGDAGDAADTVRSETHTHSAGIAPGLILNRAELDRGYAGPVMSVTLVVDRAKLVQGRTGPIELETTITENEKRGADSAIEDKTHKLTPMDDEYWIHQGVRPLSEYDESFDDGC